MQTVKDLTERQIIHYGWLDELSRDMEIANQGGYESVRPLIDISLSDDRTIEEFKASIILIKKALNSYREAVEKASYKYDVFKDYIINGSNVLDEKIAYNDLELLERLEKR